MSENISNKIKITVEKFIIKINSSKNIILVM